MMKKALKILVIGMLCFGFFAKSQPSFAGSFAKGKNAGCEECGASCSLISSVSKGLTEQAIKIHTEGEFAAHRTWLVSIFWEDNILPAMMLMAEQMTAVAMKQSEIIGTFFDAKHQMETQQVLQKLRAQAHKDYHPSTGMCEFGSSVKSLAASERLGEVNAVVMAQRSQDRALGAANTSAAGGIIADKKSRLAQYRATYCNPKDNNSAMGGLCGSGGSDKRRLNKDIDYARTVEFPWTLDVNFTQGAGAAPDEQDVLALASNLYGNEVFKRPGAGLLATEFNTDGDPVNTIRDNQRAYMNARSVLAKRSVAENSYNAIVGMKSAGTAGSRDFLASLLKELGVSDTPGAGGAKSELSLLLGDNPSYHAQMEVLTKKIYQNPDFYTNLYDKPANIERKGVALQAIALMQKFDLFKSYLRNEASMSVLLELAVIDLQEEAEGNLVQRQSGSQRVQPNSGPQ